jgi:hypothetical protein
MPPRFAYWTILVGGLPTAFRAAEREEIEPTFKQLQQKHPDAEMRWFARGKLWASPEEAREVLERHKAQGTRHKEEHRDRNWRPGGSHRDPRQPYIDAKKRENQRKRERRFQFRDQQGQRPKGKEQRTNWQERANQRGPTADDRRPRTDRPWSPKPAWKPKPKPWQGRETGDRRPPKTENRNPKTDRPWSPKPAWKPNPKPRPHPGARTPDFEGRPKEWERPGPKWKRPLDQEKPDVEKPWKPKPWQGPKTADRRPKTGSGPGAGRGRWGAPPGGPRNGPGRGRRK